MRKKLFGTLFALSLMAIAQPAQAMEWTQTNVSTQSIFVPDEPNGTELVYDTVTTTEYTTEEVTEQVVHVATESVIVQQFGDWEFVGQANTSVLLSPSPVSSRNTASSYLSDRSAGQSTTTLTGSHMRAAVKANQAIAAAAKSNSGTSSIYNFTEAKSQAQERLDRAKAADEEAKKHGTKKQKDEAEAELEEAQRVFALLSGSGSQGNGRGKNNNDRDQDGHGHNGND